MATGSCLCGTVRWQTIAPFTRMVHCHCSMCRKAHSAAFATWLSIPSGGSRWTSGEGAIRDYESSPGVVRSFCSTCGAMVAIRRPDGPALPAGNLDDDPGIKASAHVFVEDRAPWHTIADDLPQLTGHGRDDAPAPIARPKLGPATPGVLRGSCLCGDVAYERTGSFNWVHSCHCWSCRKGTAAAYFTDGGIDSILVTRGEDKLQTYRFHFCRTCGSKMPKPGDHYLSLSSLDDDPGVGPTHDNWLAGKAPWWEVPVDSGRMPGHEPQLGTAVTAHRVTPEPEGRAKMQVNWDGTIQASWQRHRALVLGIDGYGQIVLTNRLNTWERLQLRMEAGRIPVTGVRAPTSAPVPLLLAGRLAGTALVLSEQKRMHLGNAAEFVRPGPREDALTVHVEPDGVIRLADRPQQAFDCDTLDTKVGERVKIFHNHCFQNQKFVLNDDATLSPIRNREAIWGIRDGELLLVARDDDAVDRVVFSEDFAAAASKVGPGTLVEGRATPRDEGYVLELESHPGQALSVAPGPDADVKRLILVPVADAKRFIVAADHLRLAGSGAIIAFGAYIAHDPPAQALPPPVDRDKETPR